MHLRRAIAASVASLFVLAAAGCSDSADPDVDDAGKPRDASVVVREAGLAETGAPDAAPDATLDAGTDAAPSDVPDAQADATLDAAPTADAGDAAADAGPTDAGRDAPGDASPVDASVDSGVDAAVPDAGPGDASADANAPDAADAATDAAIDAAPDAATDAGTDSGTDGGADAATDAGADATTAVGHPSYFGNTAAFITGGRQLALAADSVPAGSTVSVITQTYPKGTTASVHAVYATNPQFTGATDVALAFDKDVGNNEQWYVVLPAQPSGTNVVWYLYAVGGDGTTAYDSGGGQNFHYAVP
jgi:hypothetical protein